jgi:hypothetical protein
MAMLSQVPESLTSDHGSSVTVTIPEHTQQTTEIDVMEKAPQEPIEERSDGDSVIRPAGDDDLQGHSDCNVTKQKGGLDLFMQLSRETRNSIYELSLLFLPINIRQKRFRSTSGKTEKWTEPALLKVNKTIRGEASTLYYANNPVRICTTTAEIPRACDWLAALVLRCGARPFHDFAFDVRSPRWEDIDAFASLARLQFTTGIELGTPVVVHHLSGHIDPGPSFHPLKLLTDHFIFRGLDHYGTIRYELESALLLGREGRRRQMSPERFEPQLRAWLERVKDSKDFKNFQVRKAAKLGKDEQRAFHKFKREKDVLEMLGWP